MKNYRITVNGISYDVCVEELDQNAVPVSLPVQSAPAAAREVNKSAAAQTPPPASKSAASAKAGSVKVEAPMPGKIVAVKVNVGDAVAENQVVAVLEAMKMENEIVTPKAGTVATVNITNGSDVNSGDILITIAE